MNDAATILVLDGHTTQALACVRSLGRAGYRVVVAGDRRWPLAASSRHCAARFRLDGPTPAAFAALRRWARTEGVRIVLPLTERSCVLCNDDAAAWADDGIVVGCGPNEMLVSAFDKARTFERAVACGVAVPPTRQPQSLPEFRQAAAELGFPCVVKARFSNAWHDGRFYPDPGVGYVNRAGELDALVLARKQAGHWPLIQRYVRGQGKGVFALCDRGVVRAWFAHERLRDVRPSGSGSSLRRSVALDPELRAAAERLLLHLEWHGPAMLEFRDDGATPCLIEINGRFWSSLQLAIDAGADFPLQWVRMLSNEPVMPSPSYRIGVTLRWLWGDVKRLLYIVQGPPRGYPDTYPRVWQGLRELLGRQPAGTRLETWDRGDPWPALAEWVQGIGEILAWLGRIGRRPRTPELA